MISDLTLQIAKRVFPAAKSYIESFNKIDKKSIKVLDGITEKLLREEIQNVWFVGSIGTGKTTRAFYVALSVFDRFIHTDKMYAENTEFIEEGYKSGKDDAAVSIEREYLINEMQNVMARKFIVPLNIPKLFIDIEAHRFETAFKIPSPKLAILDDFGWEVATPYTAQFFGAWIEERYGENKQHIITTNFPIEALAQKSGFEKTVDRLYQQNKTVIIRTPNINFRHLKDENATVLSRAK